jgi:hypothetical protein
MHFGKFSLGQSLRECFLAGGNRSHLLLESHNNCDFQR